MKPSFALNFCEDRIDLLHRASGGWLEVGSVPLDEPDLGAALAYLRGSALGLEPRGITTKLVIPNSQILYTNIHAPGPDAANRRRQIKAGLEGRTPYAVDDLVFDWSGTGETVQVAVIARETLAEAEAFASDHRFNPISFVAIPEAGQFASEPWFGPASMAETVLAAGEKVDRDQDPVKIVMRTALPAERAALLPDLIDPPISNGTVPEHLDIPDIILADEPVDDARELPPSKPEAHVSAPTISDPDENVGANGAIAATDLPPLPEAPPLSAPMLANAQATPAKAQIKPPVKTPQKQVSFASRRNLQAADPYANHTLPISMPDSSLRSVDEADARSVPSGEPVRIASQSAEMSNGISAKVTAPAIEVQKNRQAPRVAPAERPARRKESAALDTGPNEHQSMTTFGARKQRQRGKPRYLGLILTGILLVLLALVAAWSSVYLASYINGETPAVATTGVAETTVDAAATGTDEEPTPDDEMLADQQDPAEFADTVNNDAETIDIIEDSETQPVDSAAVADLPATSPVATPGTVAEADRNPTNEPQDEIFLAEIDPTPSTSDAIALGEPVASTDALPPAQPEPPPFGTVYTFDAQGLIVATPEGIITPEGVRLVAGRPAKTPPARPEGLSAPSTDLAAQAAVPAAAPTPVFAADPALADARPRARPADLAPVQAESDDSAALTAEATTRISSLRPRARPASALAANEAEAAANEQAELDAAVQSAAASLVASAETSASGSILAVAVSRKPAPRPAIPDKAVAEAVEAAVAAASAPVVADEPLASAPTLALAPAKEDAPTTSEAVDEPEVTSAAPDIPTRASVAKQATFKNAFNLSKTNLIGVYGTSANRYAMVRQSNGRFVKIEVGDRIDGGRVAAISEREVKYVKNGKTMTLAMPKG